MFTLLPIAVILAMLIVWKKPADVSGIVGWVVMSLVAWYVFQTSVEVILRSTAAGFIRSLSVSGIVATSLLQMAFMEQTGALQRIIVFIKTIARENRAVQVMLINIGFGTLMVAVGATPVSLLPPILVAMGYSTYVAIALPAIGYDSLCTYALLGAPIVVFVDVANGFFGKGHEITLSQAGMAFYYFLPLVSTMIGLAMLWIVGRGQAIREGLLPCLVTGAVIGVVSYFTNRHDNLVVLTGVLCGMAVIAAMVLYLKVGGRQVFDRSALTPTEVALEREYPLWRALSPWGAAGAADPGAERAAGVVRFPVPDDEDAGAGADGQRRAARYAGAVERLYVDFREHGAVGGVHQADGGAGEGDAGAVGPAGAAAGVFGGDFLRHRRDHEYVGLQYGDGHVRDGEHGQGAGRLLGVVFRGRLRGGGGVHRPVRRLHHRQRGVGDRDVR